MLFLDEFILYFHFIFSISTLIVLHLIIKYQYELKINNFQEKKKIYTNMVFSFSKQEF